MKKREVERGVLLYLDCKQSRESVREKENKRNARMP